MTNIPPKLLAVAYFNCFCNSSCRALFNFSFFCRFVLTLYYLTMIRAVLKVKRSPVYIETPAYMMDIFILYCAVFGKNKK